jgi:hypothetical protein
LDSDGRQVARSLLPSPSKSARKGAVSKKMAAKAQNDEPTTLEANRMRNESSEERGNGINFGVYEELQFRVICPIIPEYA